jgi:apolipoprotein N-acyltransferase
MERLLTHKNFIINTFILPIISGILLIFTLPPFNISLFLWFFLTPLLFFADNEKVSTKRVFQGGFIVGVIYFAKVVYPLFSLSAWWWLDVSSVVYENKIIFLFWVLYFAVLYASLLFGVFSILYRKIRKNNIIDMVLFPFIWILFEFIRAKTLAGFTWGHIGYALHNDVYILQISRIFGVYGLSFLIIFVNIGLYIILKKYIHGKGFKENFFNLIIKEYVFYVILIILTIVLSYGYFSVNTEGKSINSRKLSVSVVQLGLKTEEIKNNNIKLVTNTINQALSYSPDIVILPENSFPSLVFNKSTRTPFGYGTDIKTTEVYNKLLNISTEKNVTIILGVYSKIDEKKYNSLITIEDGAVVNIYDKRVLLPFSESRLPFLKPTESLEYGNKEQYSKVKNIPVDFLICSEIIYPELLKNKNTDLIINIGNDSVFDSPVVAEQNYIIAKIRAAENGKYLIRAMKTGISSIINPYGEVISKLDFNRSGIINSTLYY